MVGAPGEFSGRVHTFRLNATTFAGWPQVPIRYDHGQILEDPVMLDDDLEFGYQVTVGGGGLVAASAPNARTTGSVPFGGRIVVFRRRAFAATDGGNTTLVSLPAADDTANGGNASYPTVQACLVHDANLEAIQVYEPSPVDPGDFAGGFMAFSEGGGQLLVGVPFATNSDGTFEAGTLVELQVPCPSAAQNGSCGSADCNGAYECIGGSLGCVCRGRFGQLDRDPEFEDRTTTTRDPDQPTSEPDEGASTPPPEGPGNGPTDGVPPSGSRDGDGGDGFGANAARSVITVVIGLVGGACIGACVIIAVCVICWNRCCLNLLVDLDDSEVGLTKGVSGGTSESGVTYVTPEGVVLTKAEAERLQKVGSAEALASESYVSYADNRSSLLIKDGSSSSMHSDRPSSHEPSSRSPTASSVESSVAASASLSSSASRSGSA